MAFERLCLDHVKFDVARKHGEKIAPWFEYGTMWCDKIDEDIADTIQHSIINFCRAGHQYQNHFLGQRKRNLGINGVLIFTNLVNLRG